MTDIQLESGEIRPDADPRKNARSTRGRPFAPGNPGRPKGSRNRASALLDAIADDDLKAIVEKVVAKAKDGDLAAAKMIFDRIMPPPRARTVELDLPTIGRRGSWGIANATIESLGKIAAAAANGTIAPSEAVELAAVIEGLRKAVADMQPARLQSKPTKEQVEADKRSDQMLNNLLTRFG